MLAATRARRRDPAWTAEHRRRQHFDAQLAPGSNVSQEDVSQEDIDESLQETFPASDPPTWTVRARIGSPRRAPGS